MLRQNFNFRKIIHASVLILGGIIGIRLLTSLIMNRGGVIMLLMQLVILPLLIVATWKWGLLVILLPAAFFVWQQQQLFNYSFLEPLLFKAPVPEAAVYALFVVYLVKNFGKSFYTVPFANLLKFYVAIAFAVSFFGIAPDRDVVILAMRRCILAPVLAYVLVNALKSKKEIEWLILSFLGGTIFLSILSILAFNGCFEILEWHTHLDITMAETMRTNRLALAYYIPVIGGMDIGGNITVIFSSFAIPMALSLWLSFKGSSLKRYLALMTIATNFIVVVVAGSRFVWTSIVVSGALVALLHRKNMPIKVIMRLVIIICIFIAAIFLIDSMGYISDEIIYRAKSLVGVFGLKEDIYDYFVATSGGRDIVLREGLSAAIRYPFGTGFMESMAPVSGLDIGPHMQYVFLLLGTGIIGTCIFLAFLLLCAWKGFRERYTDDLVARWIVIGAISAIIAYLFDAAMIHTYLVPGADIALFMICGAGVAMIERNKL